MYFLTTNMYMDLLEQCFFSLVTFQCGLFFIYYLRYPWAHTNGQEYVLLLLQFNFNFFDYIFCLFYFNPIPLLLTFLLFGRLFFPSPFKNPKPTNEESFVYTVIFYLLFYWGFFQWDRAGSVLCWISVQCTSGTLKPFDFTLCHF